MADMDNAPIEVEEPANLRFLRILVTVLTVIMIAGVALIIALLVMRLQRPVTMSLPETITLPEGTTATAFTRSTDWIAVVTDDNRIFIFDETGEVLRQEVQVKTD